MSQSPDRTDHRRTPQIALAAHDRRDRDDMVGVSGVPDAEKKPQKEQRHQIADHIGHDRVRAFVEYRGEHWAGIAR